MQRYSSGVPSGTPEYIVGTDGKRYPSVRSTIKPELADLIERYAFWVALIFHDTDAMVAARAKGEPAVFPFDNPESGFRIWADAQQADDDFELLVLDAVIDVSQSIIDGHEHGDRSVAVYFDSVVRRQVRAINAAVKSGDRTVTFGRLND